MTAPAKNPGGRPPMPTAQKRVPLSVRITPGMRERLVALAEQNGRSIAQQTELVLQEGLDISERLTRIEQKLAALMPAPPGKNLPKA
jgi:hypothetical protein